MFSKVINLISPTPSNLIIQVSIFSRLHAIGKLCIMRWARISSLLFCSIASYLKKVSSQEALRMKTTLFKLQARASLILCGIDHSELQISHCSKHRRNSSTLNILTWWSSPRVTSTVIRISLSIGPRYSTARLTKQLLDYSSLIPSTVVTLKSKIGFSLEQWLESQTINLRIMLSESGKKCDMRC